MCHLLLDRWCIKMWCCQLQSISLTKHSLERYWGRAAGNILKSYWNRPRCMESKSKLTFSCNFRYNGPLYPAAAPLTDLLLVDPKKS